VTAWKGTVARGFTASEFSEYVSEVHFGSFMPDFIVLHNTQIPTLAQWRKQPGATWMHNLAEYYRDEKQWSGGPHLFVAEDLIWVFTPLTVPGVHAPSWNVMSWGVESVGDFDTETMSAAQLELLVSALVSLHRLAGFASPALRLHHDDPKTTHKGCPGKHFDAALIAARVAAALAPIVA
jgi:hypothetical protein